jgi:hypothetical protein
MEMHSDLSVQGEAVAQATRRVNAKAALPAITIALWAAILGAAAYFLTGVGG